jgi:hypothetical protein
MSEQVTLAEAEDRLRRTLARRSGDVPPAGDDAVPLLSPDPDLTLVPASTSGPRRRRRLVAAAAVAACVAGAAAVGVARAGGGETAEIMPADEVPATATVPAPPLTTTVPAPPVTDPGAPRPVQPLEGGENGLDPGLLPTLVAGFEQPGVAPNQEIWLYATFYPKPDMADVPAQGDTREAVAGAEVPADLDTAGDYPAINVWLRYEDGVLGLHSGMVSHDEVLAMALTVHRTPGTRDFTMTPPPGWEPR